MIDGSVSPALDLEVWGGLALPSTLESSMVNIDIGRRASLVGL